MRGFAWILVLLALLAAAGGFLALGAFPPEPRTETITKTLPNDRFGPRP